MVLDTDYASSTPRDLFRTTNDRSVRSTTEERYDTIYRFDVDVRILRLFVVVQCELYLGCDVRVFDRGLGALPGVTDSIAGGMFGLVHRLTRTLREARW